MLMQYKQKTFYGRMDLSSQDFSFLEAKITLNFHKILKKYNDMSLILHKAKKINGVLPSVTVDLSPKIK